MWPLLGFFHSPRRKIKDPYKNTLGFTKVFVIFERDEGNGSLDFVKVKDNKKVREFDFNGQEICI